MALAIFIREYFIWHYGSALKDILELAKNFFWFFYHFFSIPLLAKTLLSPIWRLSEKYRRGFDPQALFETLIVNLISRLVGFILRTILLLAGLLVELFLLLALIPVFAAWIFLPLLIPLLFLAGLTMALL
ncbi:TPA: hypothetical protein DEB04_03275 [Candidatus Giovannonibacteria bacterium]|nr:hypothetical protein [Candidatus Giovannonibacteria bacterium]